MSSSHIFPAISAAVPMFMFGEFDLDAKHELSAIAFAEAVLGLHDPTSTIPHHPHGHPIAGSREFMLGGHPEQPVAWLGNPFMLPVSDDQA